MKLRVKIHKKAKKAIFIDEMKPGKLYIIIQWQNSDMYSGQVVIRKDNDLIWVGKDNSRPKFFLNKNNDCQVIKLNKWTELIIY